MHLSIDNHQSLGNTFPPWGREMHFNCINKSWDRREEKRPTPTELKMAARAWGSRTPWLAATYAEREGSHLLNAAEGLGGKGAYRWLLDLTRKEIKEKSCDVVG